MAVSVQGNPKMEVSLPASTSSAKLLMHKNRLQEYAQRLGIPLPVYQTVNEGSAHAPKFRSSVIVYGERYYSCQTFNHRKEAEQDVAKLAFGALSRKMTDEGAVLIREDMTFCKSILNEFTVKMSLEKPSYQTAQSEGLIPVFTSSVIFDGVTYTGDAGRNKKEAEQLAARAVILAILGKTCTSGSTRNLLSEIIKSKVKLYAALHKVRDSSASHDVNEKFGGNLLNYLENPTMNKGEAVEVSSETNNSSVVAQSEILPVGQLAEVPIIESSSHEVKKPKEEEPSVEKTVGSIGNGASISSQQLSTVPARPDGTLSALVSDPAQPIPHNQIKAEVHPGDATIPCNESLDTDLNTLGEGKKRPGKKGRGEQWKKKRIDGQ